MPFLSISGPHLKSLTGEGFKRSSLLIVSVFALFLFFEVALVVWASKSESSAFLRPDPQGATTNSSALQKEATTSAAFTTQVVTSENTLDSNRPFHILILGIDRRHATDESYRSDVNMLVSFSPDRRKVVLTSIPRDLWIDGSRINAFITQEGIESVKNKIQTVLGVTPDRYVQLDFDALVEGVDALGGLDVDVPVGFTDSDYPNDRIGLSGVYTVTFPSGLQHMDGETALVYSRSRKGDNGEGSDFKRMARQQRIIQSLPGAFFSPKCIFNPFVLQNFYTSVTSRMKTDFSLKDVQLAYNLLKSFKDVSVRQIVLEPGVLYQPSPSDYGGAYVLRPVNEDFTPIHQLLQAKLSE